MSESTRLLLLLTVGLVTGGCGAEAQAQRGPTNHFDFSEPTVGSVPGVAGQALRIGPETGSFWRLPPEAGAFDGEDDFSIRFWIRSEADASRRFVLLSQKHVDDNSLASQKASGWMFYMSHGTWAWSVGSGTRRLTYERDNGHRMPLNDGRWHQLAITYDAELSQIRLFYDGVNWVSYHVSDAEGFGFAGSAPPTVGWRPPEPESASGRLLPLIESGAQRLQDFVDAFNALGQRPIESDEFLRLIVDPRELFEERAGHEVDEEAWSRVAAAEAALMENPYTIHQALEFMEAAPLRTIYALIDGRVVVREDVAARYAAREALHRPDFEIDELAIWNRVLSPSEVRRGYTDHFESAERPLSGTISSLNAVAWNIWHGGKHFTATEHGWDSRKRVAEMIAAEDVDVVMMQETYSSGDFIAAELGYYMATTVDWDYLNQGANVSVLSRYPIREVHVPHDAPFNNVGTKVQLSETQDLYVMSNWYGMNQFPTVLEFHRTRLAESDSIPVLFGGDFNAVPHTDGGDSPASVALLEVGFVDAFRDLHPDVERWPGPTHRSGRRIDQLFYKGAGLSNTQTRIISTWDRGFPSDHFMILSRFDLDYRTRSSPPP